MKDTDNMTPEYAVEVLSHGDESCDCIECVAKRVLFNELARLRAENARLLAWHDGVVAQGVHHVLSLNTTTPMIIRPQPLAKE